MKEVQFYILALVLLTISIVLFSKQEKIIETMSDNANECKDSAEIFAQIISEDEAKDEEDFQAAFQPWQKKKDAFMSGFATNVSQWGRFCADPSNNCDPSSFFTKYPGVAIHGGGFDLAYLRTDVQGCLQECLKRDDCHWVTQRRGECWLKGGANDNSGFTYLKTNTGWRGIDNIVVHGLDVGDRRELWNPDANNQTINVDFNIATVAKNGAGTWYKNILQGTCDCDIYIKNSRSNHNFLDTSPAILNNVGPKPDRKDFRRKHELTAICKDCRQTLENVAINESTDVQIKLLNDCSDKKEADQQASEKASAEQKSMTDATARTSEAEKTIPTKTETAAAAAAKAKKVKLALGLGAGLVCLLVIVAVGVGIFLYTKGKGPAEAPAEST